MFWRKDDLQNVEDFSNPVEVWGQVRKHFAQKADHNKHETNLLILIAILAALLSSIFVSFGQGLAWGKVLPALLNGCVIFSIVWLRVRQPQKLWGTYRGVQRELEREKLSYDNGIGEYESDDSNKAKILAKNLNIILDGAHQKWTEVIPDVNVLEERVKNEGD